MMISYRELFFIALAFAATLERPARAGESVAGQAVYESRCRSCHGEVGLGDFRLGPSLAGIVGAKAGTQPTGVHSRALMDSAIVWDRDGLRRFLSDPPRAIPGTIMRVGVADPAQLESLLDYLESLR